MVQARNLKLAVIIIVTVTVLGVALHSFARISYSDSSPVPEGDELRAALADGTVSDIHMFGNGEGWAITYDGLVMQYNGQAWRAVANLNEAGLRVTLRHLAMASSTYGWITGTGFDTIRNSDSPDMIWRYDGVAWTRMPSPIDAIKHIDVVAPDDGWLTNGRELLRYNGTAWEIVATIDSLSLPCDPTEACSGGFMSLDATDNDNVWVVVAGSRDNGTAINHSVYIVRYSDSGWRIEDTMEFGFDGGLNDVDLKMKSTSDGWLVGTPRVSWPGPDYREGLVKRYDGTKWYTETLAYTGTIRSLIASPSGNTIWGFGDTAKNPPYWDVDGHHLLQYSDGNWEVTALPNGLVPQYRRLNVMAGALSDSEFWAFGPGEPYHYLDGTWMNVPIAMLVGRTAQVAQAGSKLGFLGNDFPPTSTVRICVNSRLLTETVTRDQGWRSFFIQTQPTNADGGYIVEMSTAPSCIEGAQTAGSAVTARTSFFLDNEAGLVPDDVYTAVDLPSDLIPISPSMDISNTVAVPTVNPPGDNLTFTVDVKNTGAGTLVLTGLKERRYGNIADPANPELANTSCSTSEILVEYEAYQCQFSAFVPSDYGSVYTSTVTATATSAISTVVSAVDTAQIGTPQQDVYLPALGR